MRKILYKFTAFSIWTTKKIQFSGKPNDNSDSMRKMLPEVILRNKSLFLEVVIRVGFMNKDVSEVEKKHYNA